ncbi:hypothetical protein ACM9XB_20215 [Xanthomonas sacchari]
MVEVEFFSAAVFLPGNGPRTERSLIVAGVDSGKWHPPASWQRGVLPQSTCAYRLSAARRVERSEKAGTCTPARSEIDQFYPPVTRLAFLDGIRRDWLFLAESDCAQAIGGNGWCG